jgi:transposase
MRVQYGGVSDSIFIEPAVVPAKRIRRTLEQKRRIVEASLIPGVSIARVAREHGVNANQLFQWRYEYRKGSLGTSQAAHPGLVAVSVAAEPAALPMTKPASIHIDPNNTKAQNDATSQSR